MRSLLTLMVAGAMAVLLTACGQQAPKQPEVKTQPVAAPAMQQPAEAPKNVTAEPAADAVKQP